MSRKISLVVDNSCNYLMDNTGNNVILELPGSSGEQDPAVGDRG